MINGTYAIFKIIKTFKKSMKGKITSLPQSKYKLKPYLFRNVNSISAYPTKWSKTLKQFAGNLPTNYLSVFDQFVRLALKGLIIKAFSSPSHYIQLQLRQK